MSVSVCVATFESIDPSNYMHRALIRVTYKFAHELTVYEILSKVNTFY